MKAKDAERFKLTNRWTDCVDDLIEVCKTIERSIKRLETRIKRLEELEGRNRPLV